MADQFDPYRKWLGISSQDQPPNHYQLLGIPVLEEDPDVIENAANRQMAHVRTFQSGKHSKLSQQILNELAAAKRVLLTADKKTKYDTELKSQLPTAAADPASPAPPPPSPPTQPPPPTPATQPPPPTPATQPPPHNAGTRQNPAATSQAANSVVEVRSRQPNVVRRHRRKHQKSSAIPLLFAIVALAILIGIIVLAVNYQKTRPSPEGKSTQKKVSLVTSWQLDKEVLSDRRPARAAAVAKDCLP